MQLFSGVMVPPLTGSAQGVISPARHTSGEV